MALNKKYFKKFENEMVEITYRDGSKILCYVDHVGSETLAYKTRLEGINEPDHLFGFHIISPEIKFDEIEKIEELSRKSEIKDKLYDIDNKLEKILKCLIK